MPTVDESDEPFQWGFPDLTGLRSFLQAELSWSISKADDELTPIVQRIALRGQSGGLHKQTRLDPFFDMSLGTDAYIPRVRAHHPSKRLQSVIRAYREAEARARGEAVPKGFGAMLQDLEEERPLVKVDEAEVTGSKPRAKRKGSQAGEGGVEGGKRKRRAPAKQPSSGGAGEVTGDLEDGVTGAGAGADPPAGPMPKKRRPAARKPSHASSRSQSRAGSSAPASVVGDADVGAAGPAPGGVPAAPRPKPRRKKQTIEI